MTRGENAAQGGESGEVDVVDERGVGDQEGGAGIFQLEEDLALAIRGIEKRWDSAGEGGGVVGDGKFPGVGKKDGDDFAGSKSGADQAASEGVDAAGIFRKGETAVGGTVIARSIDQGDLAGGAPAALEDDVVDEAAGGIGAEMGTGHGRDCNREWIDEKYRGKVRSQKSD